MTGSAAIRLVSRLSLVVAGMALAAAGMPAGAQTVVALRGPAPVTAPEIAGPEVTVPGGTVRGAVDPAGQFTFEGIPFAAPPLGDLRWRPPAPPAPWQGVRDATRPPPACIQVTQGWNRADYVDANEDCLTLDVGTQSLAGRRPVVVWIHGGSNKAGSPRGMVHSSLVQRGVVVVGIRYRLGLLGFLSHRAFAAEANGASGNYGLMDQMAALAWVRANIASFGGDPGNITITGESAGSMDVGLLLAAPGARTLFDKAGMESGTPQFGMPPRPLAEALAIGDQLQNLLGVSDASALRRASVAALIAADDQLVDPAINLPGYIWLRPTIDGAVLPDTPARLLAAAPSRPLLIGTNRIELTVPGGDAERYIDVMFPLNRAAANTWYASPRTDDPRLGDAGQILSADGTFRCPAGRMAALVSDGGAPVWRYEFDYGPNGGLTTHAHEIGYIFGDARIGTTPPLHLQDYWVNFARTGNPNGAGADGTPLPRWPGFSARRPVHIRFGPDTITTGTNLGGTPCAYTDAL